MSDFPPLEGASGSPEPDIIPRNDAQLSCEETIPNTSQDHSTLRHGFTGGSLQYVPGLFFESTGGVGPDEQFSRRSRRPGPGSAAFDDSAPGQLATHF